jgi:hypothetical protein
VQHGAKLSERMATGTPGDRDDPAMTGNPNSLGRRNGVMPNQMRMDGTRTGRGTTPKSVTKPGYYANRDLEVRPGVGGSILIPGAG